MKNTTGLAELLKRFDDAYWTMQDVLDELGLWDFDIPGGVAQNLERIKEWAYAEIREASRKGKVSE